MAIIQKDGKEFKIPEGKEIKSVDFWCPKHGKITDKSFISSYILPPTQEGQKPSKHNHIFCTACICEYLESLRKEGKIAEVTIVPTLVDIEKSKEVTDANSL